MEIKVDRDLCEGNVVCVGLVPKVFALNEDDDQVELLEPNPGEELLPRVRKAVKRCPKAALSLHE